MKSKLSISRIMCFAILLAPISAFSADGDVLRTIIAERTGTACESTDPDGNHSSINVGIAFDGTSLLVSCYGDNTVSFIDPADGSQLEVHSISNASSLGALAWDNGRGLLWACSNSTSIGTIDLATDIFTPVFTGPCFDGLAYDASDDTIWASADATWPISHYMTDGTLLGDYFQPSGWSGAGNSGIAVGGQNLYMANNGNSQIYVVDKAVTSASLFATLDRRQEGLECDNITFDGLGKNAIWTIDAYDNVLNALEIPIGSCSFGGGVDLPSTPVPFMSRWATITVFMLLVLFAYGHFRRRMN